jgi:hypothetical protein
VDTVVKNSIKFSLVSFGEEEGKAQRLHFHCEFTLRLLGKGTFQKGDHIPSGNICANKGYLSASKLFKTFAPFPYYMMI